MSLFLKIRSFNSCSQILFIYTILTKKTVVPQYILYDLLLALNDSLYAQPNVIDFEDQYAFFSSQTCIYALPHSSNISSTVLTKLQSLFVSLENILQFHFQKLYLDPYNALYFSVNVHKYVVRFHQLN